MSIPDEARVMEGLVARIREAELRAAHADKLTTEVEALRARIHADADELRSLRSAAAAAKATEKQLDAAKARIDRLLMRVANAEQRRDAAVAAEAEALARCTQLESELLDVAGERDRAIEELRRFRDLRWNRLGVRLRVPVNRIRAMVGR